MKDLIKKVLRENVGFISENNQDILSKLANYAGNDNLLNSIKSKIDSGLSERQLDVVKSKLYKNYITSKGIDAYSSMINSDKKYFLKNANTMISNPDKTWVLKNINDLEKFLEKLNPHYKFKEIKLGNKSDIVLNFIENEINNINNRVGFIDDGNWSVLNKIDTNYSNWFDLINQYDKKGELGNGTYESKIDNFFKERPINEILGSKKLDYIYSLENQIGKKLPKISYADYEMMIELFSGKHSIRDRIKKTTGIGDSAEAEFFDLLKDVPKENILNFSSPGNIVDMVFGVDCMIKMTKKGDNSSKWYPVQIKNNSESAKKVNIFKIGGISVFPNKGGFGYYTSKGDDVPGNFFEDFSFGNPKIPSSYDYLASQGIK